jgi:hypothetical protein
LNMSGCNARGLCRNLLCNVLLLRDSTSYTTWKIAIRQSHDLCGNLPASVLGALVSLIQLGDVELGGLEKLHLADKHILQGVNALGKI